MSISKVGPEALCDPSDKNPFSVKADVLFSQIASVLSVLLIGFGVHTFFYISEYTFPAVLVGFTLWGMSCIGLRRAWEIATRNNKGHNEG